MPRHSLKALVLGALLIPLAWIGFVLVGKLHGNGALLPAVVIWGIVFVADAILAVWSLVRSREHRVGRTPEPPSRIV